MLASERPAGAELPTRRSQPVIQVPVIPLPPVLPTPAEAAFNAAVIVSEMVDIDSESGAVIAAAAAAGAAIEAAVAAKKVAAVVDAARAEAAAAMQAAIAASGEMIAVAPDAGQLAASVEGASGANPAAATASATDRGTGAAAGMASATGAASTGATGAASTGATGAASTGATGASATGTIGATGAASATGPASATGTASAIGATGAASAIGAAGAIGAADTIGSAGTMAAGGAAGTMAAGGAAGAASGAADSKTQMPALGGTSDPVTTVKLSRERILQALADEGPGGPRHPRARTEPGANRDSAPSLRRARSEPGLPVSAALGVTAGTAGGAGAATGAAGVPGAAGAPLAGTGATDGLDEAEEFDPVAIAAAAIARLRTRAKTDLGHLRLQYQRHDGLVLLLALVLIIVAGRVHASLVTPPTETFDDHGLTFEHSTAWLAPEPAPLPSPRLVRDALGGAATAKDPAVYHVELTSTIDPAAKVEVLIDKLPKWSNTVMWLELDRRTRWGELYVLDDSTVRSIEGHDWLRTAYRYAHAEKNDVPRVDHAVEYATIDRDQIYVITLFGSPGELDRMEDVIAPSLRVRTQTGQPLVPQTGRLEQRQYPGPVGRAFDSTVMVIVADLVDGRLKARGGGSGVIVGGDGSVLTNYHVIHEQGDPNRGKEDRLHDIFVIARYSTLDRAPQVQCAGRPSRSKLQPKVDLALIKCDMDLDGRAWIPSSSGVWATLEEAKASDVKIGERLWVLGYPDVGGGGLTLFDGVVEGWTGPDGSGGRDFIKTSASISSGSSGGPVVDDQGKLVGIASAFRTNGKIGLVRPLQTASQILAYAAAGWTPLEGHTEVELTPTAVEASTEGIRIYTTVVDDANEVPIRDALVMVLRPGVSTSAIDLNRLDDQAIAWGKTNAQGEVRLKQLVPVGTYSVIVMADGYEPLIGDSELHLDNKTPPSFDPWGKIGLRSR